MALENCLKEPVCLSEEQIEEGWKESHYGGIVVADPHNRNPSLLAVCYKNRNMQFAGGMGLKGETPLETIVREARQELGLIIPPEKIKLIWAKEELKFHSKDIHRKFFGIVNVHETTGEIKTKSSDNETGPPVWVKVVNLMYPPKKTDDQPRLPDFSIKNMEHKIVMAEAVEFLRIAYSNYGAGLSDINFNPYSNQR